VGEDICTVVDRIENDSAGAAAADDAIVFPIVASVGTAALD